MGRAIAAPKHPVGTNTASRALARARQIAFTPEQAQSLLARRPYDLRHAAVSTWLAAGVDATQVATWAGHSVAVLLKVYAHTIQGRNQIARDRITQALAASTTPPQHPPGQMPGQPPRRSAPPR